MMCGLPGRRCVLGEVVWGLQNQSISLKDIYRNRAQIPGLSTFNPFSEENAFQVDTKTRLGSKFLPGIWALFL